LSSRSKSGRSLDEEATHEAFRKLEEQPETARSTVDPLEAVEAVAAEGAEAPGKELVTEKAEKVLERDGEELEITFGTGGLALPKFGGEKKPATSGTS